MQLDAETVSNDGGSSAAVGKLQGCFDELKQKLQRVNITSDHTVSTAPLPVLKETLSERKEMLNSITSDVVNKSDVISESPESTNEESNLSQGLRSLPLIYNVGTNPSIDDQDGEVWK